MSILSTLNTRPVENQMILVSIGALITFIYDVMKIKKIKKYFNSRSIFNKIIILTTTNSIVDYLNVLNSIISNAHSHNVDYETFMNQYSIPLVQKVICKESVDPILKNEIIGTLALLVTYPKLHAGNSSIPNEKKNKIPSIKSNFISYDIHSDFGNIYEGIPFCPKVSKLYDVFNIANESKVIKHDIPTLVNVETLTNDFKKTSSELKRLPNIPNLKSADFKKTASCIPTLVDDAFKGLSDDSKSIKDETVIPKTFQHHKVQRDFELLPNWADVPFSEDELYSRNSGSSSDDLYELSRTDSSSHKDETSEPVQPDDVQTMFFKENIKKLLDKYNSSNDFEKYKLNIEISKLI